MDEGHAVVTTDLVEEGGRTSMTATVRYPSQRLRDAMLATNMARGVGEELSGQSRGPGGRPPPSRRRRPRSRQQRKGAVTRMSEISDRYRTVAAQFTERVKAVPDSAWSNPARVGLGGAPCRAPPDRLVAGLLLRPVGRRAWPVPSVDDDPPGAAGRGRHDPGRPRRPRRGGQPARDPHGPVDLRRAGGHDLHARRAHPHLGPGPRRRPSTRCSTPARWPATSPASRRWTRPSSRGCATAATTGRVEVPGGRRRADPPARLHGPPAVNRSVASTAGDDTGGACRCSSSPVDTDRHLPPGRPCSRGAYLYRDPAGKSTVARLLAGPSAARADPPATSEDAPPGDDAQRPGRGDAFFGFLARGAVAPWLPGSHEQNEIVTRAAATTAGRFAAEGYDTVFDGMVGPWFLPTFAEATGLDRLDYVVLLPRATPASTGSAPAPATASATRPPPARCTTRSWPRPSTPATCWSTRPARPRSWRISWRRPAPPDG